MPCGDITVGSTYDCDNPLQGGTKPRLVLFNKTDIASVTQSGGIISAITRVSGKVGYAFSGFKNSNIPSSEKKTAASGQALFKHQVQFFIYENTQAAKNNMEKMANGQIVAIIQNSKEDAQAFEVMGLGVGMEMVDGPLNNKNENNGAYSITLATAENQGEARLPQTFFITSYAASLAAVDALLAA
jgi:hypothetical protein